MDPGDMIIENLSKNGVRASVIDLGREEDFNQYVADHPSQVSYLLPDGITENGWKKFAARLPRSVVIGVHGSIVRIKHDRGKNPVFHRLHVVEAH